MMPRSTPRKAVLGGRQKLSRANASLTARHRAQVKARQAPVPRCRVCLAYGESLDAQGKCPRCP